MTVNNICFRKEERATFLYESLTMTTHNIYFDDEGR